MTRGSFRPGHVGGHGQLPGISLGHAPAVGRQEMVTRRQPELAAATAGYTTSRSADPERQAANAVGAA